MVKGQWRPGEENSNVGDVVDDEVIGDLVGNNCKEADEFEEILKRERERVNVYELYEEEVNLRKNSKQSQGLVIDFDS
ncbi:hypothetical protein WN944_004237 [Citrus x changshan-huyou]|uniref:Uncharacterized protein n=1 Tax=Citrus x changshan-huyou TaxID=2935761 RepID=A0AAP0M014_9ROSI